MNDPSHPIFRIYNVILQLSIVVFTAALVYFAFVYYPKVIRDYKSGKIPPGKPMIASVAAVGNKFPIETSGYRIVHEEKSNAYYVFIAGNSLDQYLLNKDGASLTLKSALSEDSLCDLNVIYVSTAKLEIPQQYKTDVNCK